MKCPNCSINLVMSDRQGIEIDYCPDCRGVWLDRGELDKIIERANNEVPSSSGSQARSSRRDDSDEIEELPAEDKKKLSPAIKEGCKHFDKYWKKCFPDSVPVVSGPDAYGEPTAGTTARIWDPTHRLIGIKSTDIVVDIGSGAGKLLHSSKFFCPT